MPGPDRGAGFDRGRGASKLNQNDQRRSHRGGGGRMQHDAKLAVVGVSGRWVDVSHLNHRQQSQQNHAQSRRGYGK